MYRLLVIDEHVHLLINSGVEDMRIGISLARSKTVVEIQTNASHPSSKTCPRHLPFPRHRPFPRHPPFSCLPCMAFALLVSSNLMSAKYSQSSPRCVYLEAIRWGMEILRRKW